MRKFRGFSNACKPAKPVAWAYPMSELMIKALSAEELVDAQTFLMARIKVLREACKAVDDLIGYQYTGSREAMTALQRVCDQCHAALEQTK